MQRCLDLAQHALGATYPNPLVGAVLVHQGKIIGEGWHRKAGEPHAEVNAIVSVADKTQLSESTLYVNLEPCAHFGKTPPCVHIIKEYKIPRVVIGSLDPNPKVAGKGIQALKKWGCEVTHGVLKKKSDFLNRRFFTFHKQKRPYLILKWAQTADHFIAPDPSDKNDASIFWITNLQSRQRVHQWRSQESAILVGVQTLVDDNPQLTTRDWKGTDPLRLVLDPNLRTPKNTTLYKDNTATYFFHQQPKVPSDSINRYIFLNPYNLKEFLGFCYTEEIQSVIVEGGQKTLQGFIDQNLWDEARVFQSEEKIMKGIPAPVFMKKATTTEFINGDRLISYFN